MDNRQLLILRHGKSDWATHTDDFHRPLKKRGVDAAQNIGRWLLDHSLLPDCIISSPATRAISTAYEVADAIGLSEITQDDRIYEASLSELLEVLSDIPAENRSVLIAGHNPGFENLLLYLAEVAEHFYKDWKLLTTGTLAVLTMPENWQALESKCAKLEHLIRGKDLA